MRPSEIALSTDATEAARLADFRELLKPGIAAFVVVMAAARYLLGADGAGDWASWEKEVGEPISRLISSAISVSFAA